MLVDTSEHIRSVEASSILMGCAELGEHPGTAVTQACCVALEQDAYSNAQAVANVTWALAVLEVSYLSGRHCLPRCADIFW